MSGVRLEVETHIITASHTNLKNIDRCMENVGVQNDGFIFAGLASSEAVLTDTEKELGVVCVDIGGGSIDIDLYVDGSLSYSSSIPIGAKHITNDIAVGMRVSLDSAEKIKLFLSRKIGSMPSRAKHKIEELNFHDLSLPESVDKIDMKMLIDGIIGPRLEELFKMITDEIVKSNYIEHVPSGLVITGGGALTVGILEMGRKIVGLPIRIGIPSKVTGLVDEVLDPQYSTTVGLILYGRKNIINKEEGFKNFNKILKDFSFGGSVGKLKDFFKQFIP
jgi:cell division protein FtsA